MAATPRCVDCASPAVEIVRRGCEDKPMCAECASWWRADRRRPMTEDEAARHAGWQEFEAETLTALDSAPRGRTVESIDIHACGDRLKSVTLLVEGGSPVVMSFFADDGDNGMDVHVAGRPAIRIDL